MSLLLTATQWMLQSFAVVMVVLLTTVILQEMQRPRNMPPTPGDKRPLPLVGHMLLLPKQKSWMSFRKWNEECGPILTVWNGNRPTILIGDAEVRKLRKTVTS